MSSVQISALPDNAFLGEYARSGAYTDCYSVALARSVSLAEFMAAFYTTPIFKVERLILTVALRRPSSDRDASDLALGNVNSFAAWDVESRNDHQTVLAAGRTRSWLMVAPAESDTGTRLYFGSAVVPGSGGKLGWPFHALLGFHKAYSRILLGAAARRLSSGSRRVD